MTAPLSAEQIERALAPGRGRPAPTRRASEPWGGREALTAGVLASGGLLGLSMAWFDVSGRTAQDPQITAVVLGIAAAVLTAGAYVVWLLAGFRAVRTRTETTRRASREAVAALVNAQPSWQRSLLGGTTTPGASTGEHVTAAGMTHYHRGDCLLMRRKDALAQVPADRTPCGVCRP